MTTLPPAGGDLEAPDTLRRELRTVYAVIRRDLLRITSRPLHTAMTLLQPLVFLLALGGGLAAVIPSAAVGGDYRTYLFPGVLVMTVQLPAMGAGVRLIEDGSSGFLRETLMAPARRSTLLVAMCLGGTAVAAVQGVILLAVAGLAGIPYQPLLLGELLLVLVLTAFALSSMTLLLAVALDNVETFHTLLGLGMLPLTFLSGGFFPLASLPDWLEAVVAANPLAYAVDLLHHALAAHTGAAAVTGVRWAGWAPPVPLELLVLVALSALTLLTAARRFARPA